MQHNTVTATQAQWRRPRSTSSAYYIDDLQMFTCVRHHCEYRRCRVVSVPAAYIMHIYIGMYILYTYISAARFEG